MTKNTNEVIIDGVDVSGCVCFETYNIGDKKFTDCKLHDVDYGLYGRQCHHNPNCYFKQLQRLKKENEELKEDNLEFAKVVDKLSKECEVVQINLDELGK